MVVEHEFSKALQQLGTHDQAHLDIGHSSIFMKVAQKSRLHINTRVYQGEQFIPKQVRQAMKHPIDDSDLHTSLHLNEASHQIHLQFIGDVQNFSKRELRNLLTQFASLADKWRVWLDENDKNDRVRVPKKP